MRSKVETMIMFAQKSGEILYGYDKIKVAKKVEIVLADKTMSEKSLKEIKFLCQKNNIKLILCEEALEQKVNKKNCKLIGITNRNLADGILNNLSESYELVGGTEING